jgi:hypothetical protein
MKNKKLLFISAFLCLGSTVFAQKNYQKAWLVLNDGDSLHGLVDYRNWERNPETISFKSSENAEVKNYTVKDLQAFNIPGEDHYLRAIVTKDMLPVQLNTLEFEGTQKMVADTVFLRSVIQGDKVSLYELIDEKAHYFIQQPGGPFEELIYRIYLSRSDRTLSITREIYKDQLKRFAIENTSLRNRIDRSAYDENDLASVVRKLNGSTIDEKETSGIQVPRSRLFAGA